MVNSKQKEYQGKEESVLKPNWTKIRYEYITTSASYRDLSKKYGVSFNTLSKRAKREGWADRRKNNDDKLTAKIVDAYNEQETERRRSLMETADTLLDQVNKILMLNPDLEPKDVRVLSAALKDIKDVKNTDADIREQEAKIKNLERAASEENPVVSVEFKMPEGMESLAE